MNYKVTPALVNKYIAGNCTADEVASIYQWYDSFENEDEPFVDLNNNEQEALKMLMLNKFKASIAVSPAVVNEDEIAKVKRFPIKLAYLLSAIAALFILVWGIRFDLKIKEGSNIIITTASEQMVLSNQTNSYYKQILSDGSIVWLSPKSQLEYPKKFMGAYRQVKMSGGAFFEVSKDHAHPFIIYSGGIVTRVWGTSFRISAYKNTPTEVSVVTGKVSVKIPEKDNSEVMLMPAQKVIAANTNLEVGKVSSSDMRIWDKTSIAFDNTPMDEVLDKLNDHFNTHIFTNDTALEKYFLKADFTDQNLPTILDMLESSLNVGYNLNGTTIELYRKTQTN